MHFIEIGRILRTPGLITVHISLFYCLEASGRSSIVYPLFFNQYISLWRHHDVTVKSYWMIFLSRHYDITVTRLPNIFDHVIMTSVTRKQRCFSTSSWHHCHAIYHLVTQFVMECPINADFVAIVPRIYDLFIENFNGFFFCLVEMQCLLEICDVGYAFQLWKASG